MTGPFGGYGGFVRTKPDIWDYAIEPSFEDKPAMALRAVAYCPGYEIRIFDVASIDDSAPRDIEVELKPLGWISLSGKVRLPNRASVGDLNIHAA